MHSPGGGIELNAQHRHIRRADQESSLTDAQFKLLECLIKHRGDFVSKDELMEALWPDRAGGVTESALGHRIQNLRERFAKLGLPKAIENQRGCGYRLTCEVENPLDVPPWPNTPAVARLVQSLGCLDVFIASNESWLEENQRRNAVKTTAIKQAALAGQTVRLLAETGHSYLSAQGHFYAYLTELLRSGGTFQAILTNPYFLEGHGISAAYLEPQTLDQSGLHPDHLRKFQASCAGYARLQTRYDTAVLQVRVSRYGIPATILMTDDAIFFEPYVRSNRSRRLERRLDTFELYLDGKQEHMRTLFDEQFRFYLECSDALDTRWDAKVARYQALLQDLKKIWEE